VSLSDSLMDESTGATESLSGIWLVQPPSIPRTGGLTGIVAHHATECGVGTDTVQPIRPEMGAARPFDGVGAAS
jgi:hypothetical protein